MASSVLSGYVMNDGNPLSYLEWGSSEKPSLILIAPIRHPAYIWRGVAERLSHEFHVIGANLRGYSDSGPFPSRAYDPDGYVSDLLTLVDGLALAPVTTIAFSVVMSGATVAFAAQHPDLVRSLVLLDGGMGYTPAQAIEAGERVSRTPAEFPDWDAAIAHYSGMIDQRFATPELVRERAPYVFRRLPSGAVTWKHDEILRTGWPGEDWKKNTGWLPEQVWEQVQCPILVVKASDHITVESCEQITRYGRDSRWVEVPDVTSHFVHDENPDGFLRAVGGFLRER